MPYARLSIGRSSQVSPSLRPQRRRELRENAHGPAAERVPDERGLALRPAGGEVDLGDVAQDGVERERERRLVLDEAVEARAPAVLSVWRGEKDRGLVCDALRGRIRRGANGGQVWKWRGEGGADEVSSRYPAACQSRQSTRTRGDNAEARVEQLVDVRRPAAAGVVQALRDGTAREASACQLRSKGSGRREPASRLQNAPWTMQTSLPSPGRAAATPSAALSHVL